jgi:hypothetical protein
MVKMVTMAGYLQTRPPTTRDSVVKFLFRNENRGVALALPRRRREHVDHG